MKKQLMTAVLASSILFSSVPLYSEVFAAAQSAEIVSGVSFREGPSTSNKRIRYLKKGEQVIVLEQVNAYWYKVQTSQGELGYVSTNSKYIEVEQAPPAKVETNATVIRSVSFRTGPSTSHDRIRYLKTGETLHILEQPNSYWYKVETQQGETGYVSSNSKYIEVTTQQTPPETNEDIKIPEPNQNVIEANARVVKSVSFRSGPSTSDSRIRYLKTGESLQILEQTSKYWYKVKTELGDVGYVSTSETYIETDYVQPLPTIPENQVSNTVQSIIDAGMKYLGTPYEYGSSRSTTTTFDCSDFVRQAFLDGANILLPADSRKQGDYVKQIGKTSTNWKDLKPGDILFFMSYKGSKASSYAGINKAEQRITHDAIYLGDGKILHTYSKESGGVKVDTLEGRHWEHRFLFGGSAF